MIAACVLAVTTVAVVAVPFLTGARLDRIEARPVAHLSAPSPKPAHEHAHAPTPDQTPDAPVAWTLPDGWAVIPTQQMRLASFSIAGGGTCGLFLFPGGGDRLSNVNRWRGQAGLALLDAAELEQALTAGSCAFGPFQWLALRGEKTSFLAAIVPTTIGQCFVKLEAPGNQLEALRAGFLAFTSSLRPAGTAP